MNLTKEEVIELMLFLNILLYRTQESMEQTQDIQELDALDERQETLTKWITRLSGARFAGVDTFSLKHLLRSNKDNGPFDEYLQAVQREVQWREEA